MKNVNLKIYSPRWGHHDTYHVELHLDYMKITMHPKEAKATYIDNRDPEWSGESLQRIMNNDSVYPPEITPRLFQRAWLAWRDGELDDNQVAQELEQVAEWINKITEAKPNSDFWQKYF
ncbi:hypothetical protein RA180_22150 [Aeromonas salmonicida]|uniref:hypothetical protein n=1 Tax=Aeromonas salmonicida TaxID=645 RepID=UPI002796A591|nr:hypothetical protein [Aeromonas salmonicida]MDQ1886691.1 hypothetical protein [Aeromonas salmonicida]